MDSSEGGTGSTSEVRRRKESFPSSGRNMTTRAPKTSSASVGGGSGGFENPGFPGELAGQAVQSFGAGLANGGVGRVLLEPSSLGADDQRDDQHTGEGKHILIVGDGERQVGRNAEKIEGGDAQKGRSHGDPAAAAHGDHDHADEVQHGEVGGRQGVAQEHRGDGGDAHDGDRQKRLAYGS